MDISLIIHCAELILYFAKTLTYFQSMMLTLEDIIYLFTFVTYGITQQKRLQISNNLFAFNWTKSVENISVSSKGDVLKET